MNLSENFQFNLIKKSFAFLNSREKKTVGAVSAAQAFLGMFDIVGVSFFGAIASLVMSSINSQPPASLVQTLLSILRLEQSSLQTQTATLAIIGVSILGFKTFVTYKLSNIVLRELSVASARVSKIMLSRILHMETNYLKVKNDQEMLYDLTTGISVLTIGVLGIAISLLSDFVLLVVIFIGVLYLNLSVAVFTVMMFACVLILLRRFIDFRAHALSREAVSASIISNTTIIEILENLQAITVSSASNFFENKVFDERVKLNKILAQQTLLPNIGKSILEVSVLFGVLLISGFEFLLYDSKHAILNLSIFLISASRVTPAVLRIQYGLLQIKSSSGTSESALLLLDKIHNYSALVDSNLIPFNANFKSLIAKKIKYRIPESDFNLAIENLEIPAGKFIAIVGPSGGGKSTLVKILTGLIRQDEGVVSFKSQSIRDILQNQPGVISYVPQRVGVLSENLEMNVTFGRDFSSDQLEKSLVISDLKEWLTIDREVINNQLMFNASSLSGGQRQRLGIARAVISAPEILFLDEATSAIDGHSEETILRNLREELPNMSLVVVAHRLSSVIEADEILYIDNGRLVASGNFSELRGKVRAFDKQAKSMGM